jgi:predicted enzyme related to lactoylglutathione lyase
MSTELQGLRTVIYPVTDVAAAKSWWTEFLGKPPYFDQPFYVGFDVAGYELGILPSESPVDGALTYWGVESVAATIGKAVMNGAEVHSPAAEVGDGIITGTVRLRDGSIVGFITNPHFALPS